MSCGLDIGCQLGAAAQTFLGWGIGTLNAVLDGVPWGWVIPSLILGAVLGKPGTALLVGSLAAVRSLRQPDRHEHVSGTDAAPPVRKPRPTIFSRKK